MKNLNKILVISIITIAFGINGYAQTNRADKKAAKIAAISKMIDTKNFVFVANVANPTRGMQTRQLTGEYDLTLAGDTVIAYLPYFGRAYLADYNSATNGGIKFTTSKFDYQVTLSKKGNREIFITPLNSSLSDPTAVKTLRLDITADGYATLLVISLNRDPISFDGELQAREKPKS